MVNISIGDVSTIATIVLVGITAYYAISTHKYLKEFQKDRKVRLIQERLEKFYSPYLNNLHVIDFFSLTQPTDINFDYALKTVTEIGNHAYLVDRDSVRSQVEEYFSMMMVNGIEYSEHGARFKELRKSVNQAVRDDYERLLKRLEELMN